MHQFLSGIQQVGIGVCNATKAMHTYKHLFGMDVLIFDDEAKASLMTQYTGNEVRKRRAILTMNLQGGGGFEIWQFQDRVPQKGIQVQLGHIGINATILKSHNILQSHNRLSKIEGLLVLKMEIGLDQKSFFYVTDSDDNIFKIIPSDNWFQKKEYDLGGVVGAVVGVRDMDKSLDFYKNILGIDTVLYDGVRVENNQKYHIIGLSKKATGKGAFNKLLGDVTLELVQILDTKAPKIYENRFWGDCGFIHLCFDVVAMDALKAHVIEHGLHFSVDSNNTFAMDNASGRFCYIEDPDGTLIELVETHKVPILKKVGWYLDLRKRNQEKPLPDWMIKMLALSKVK